jgi:hypothetical protein
VIEAKGTNGRVTFDGVLVTIHRGGARRFLRGTGIRSIPARVITDVDLKPAGLGRGWIRFGVDPDEDEAAEPDDLDDEDAEDVAGGFDPARDPNTVMFARGRQRDFEDVRREVKTAMWEARRDEDDEDEDFPPTQHVLPQGPAAVRDLRTLAQLLHEGVLSRAEFDRAKARLMDRI